MYTKKLTNLLILSVAISSPMQAIKQVTKDTIKNTAVGTAWTLTAVATAACAAFHVYLATLVDISDDSVVDYDDALGGLTIIEHNVLVALVSGYCGYKAFQKALSYFKKIKASRKLNAARNRAIKPVA